MAAGASSKLRGFFPMCRSLTHRFHRVCAAYSVSQLCFLEILCVGQEFKLVVRGKQFLLDSYK